MPFSVTSHFINMIAYICTCLVVGMFTTVFQRECMCNCCWYMDRTCFKEQKQYNRPPQFLHHGPLPELRRLWQEGTGASSLELKVSTNSTNSSYSDTRPRGEHAWREKQEFHEIYQHRLTRNNAIKNRNAFDGPWWMLACWIQWVEHCWQK